jgi:hypothetical protein
MMCGFVGLLLFEWFETKKKLKFVVHGMCVKEKYPCSIQRLVLVLLFLMSNVKHAHLGSKLMISLQNLICNQPFGERKELLE